MQKDNKRLKTELDNSQRYTKLIDQKYCDLCKAEEQANLRVLTLLDDVQRLTKENQDLLELQREMAGIELTEPSHDVRADSAGQSQVDYALTPAGYEVA